MKKFFTCVSSSAAVVAFAAITFATSGFSETVHSPTAESVQKVLMDQMGSEAKDLKVSVDQGTINLMGWVKGPREVNQARYIVSKLPGVEHAYSSGVRTWVATDR